MKEQKPAQPQASVYTPVVYTLISLMIVFGACNTLVSSWQNSFTFTYNDKFIKFHHPFIQAIAMFIGEAFSLIVFFIYINVSKDDYHKKTQEDLAKGQKQSILKYFYLGIPAAFDFTATTISYTALNWLSPSIYQMLRGALVIITASLSKFFLKRILYKHNYFGILSVFIGVVMVGASGFFEKKKSSGVTSGEFTTGVILQLISLLFLGCLYISEEKIVRTFTLVPYEIVGTEGCWGLIYYSIFLPILCAIKCSPTGSFKSMCVGFPGKQEHLESTSLYFWELRNGPHGLLIVAVLMGICTIGCFNVCGVNVTKRVSALARSVVDASRTVIIWIVSIIVTATYGKHNEYFQWESLAAGIIIIKLIGFVFLLSGNGIYNQIIKLPFAMPPPAGSPVFESDRKKAQEQPKIEPTEQTLLGNSNNIQDNTEGKPDMPQEEETDAVALRKKYAAKESVGSVHN